MGTVLQVAPTIDPGAWRGPFERRCSTHGTPLRAVIKFLKHMRRDGAEREAGEALLCECLGGQHRVTSWHVVDRHGVIVGVGSEHGTGVVFFSRRQLTEELGEVDANADRLRAYVKEAERVLELNLERRRVLGRHPRARAGWRLHQRVSDLHDDLHAVLMVRNLLVAVEELLASNRRPS